MSQCFKIHILKGVNAKKYAGKHFFSLLGCVRDRCHLLVGDIVRAQLSELVPGCVTENSSIHPPGRFSTVETEEASVDKSDKNAVFYLNYLPVTEDAQCLGRVLLLYHEEEYSDFQCSCLASSAAIRTEMESEVKLIFLFHSTSTFSTRGQ